MRYMLSYLPRAREELAELWLSAADRSAVTESSDFIDHELRDDPHEKGEAVDDALRLPSIVEPPLIYYYVVSPDDCLATVWSVRWAKPHAASP
jgi:hypothetical protein